MPAHRFDGFTQHESGHIYGSSYDSMKRQLTIKFKNGYVYHVHGISPEDHQAFLDAPSQGEHFHHIIKENYHVERVRVK